MPRISALEGDPDYQPQPADMRPARHRNPSMKTLVHWAMEAENAEALSRKLKARFERRKRRRTDAQLDAEVDRMLDRGRAE